jgi:hypothetical protein
MSTEKIQAMERREIVNFGRILRILLDNKPVAAAGFYQKVSILYLDQLEQDTT